MSASFDFVLCGKPTCRNFAEMLPHELINRFAASPPIPETTKTCYHNWSGQRHRLTDGQIIPKAPRLPEDRDVQTIKYLDRDPYVMVYKLIPTYTLNNQWFFSWLICQVIDLCLFYPFLGWWVQVACNDRGILKGHGSNHLWWFLRSWEAKTARQLWMPKQLGSSRLFQQLRWDWTRDEALAVGAGTERISPMKKIAKLGILAWDYK